MIGWRVVYVWNSGLGGDPGDDAVQFALPQRADQIAGEDEALTLPPRQPLINAMIGAGIERGRHRCAEPAAQRGRIAVDQMAVERSEEHTSELQSLMRISYAVFCLK